MMILYYIKHIVVNCKEKFSFVVFGQGVEIVWAGFRV